mgnify:CR=1 FL=1
MSRREAPPRPAACRPATTPQLEPETAPVSKWSDLFGREGSADVIFLNFGSLLHEARKVSENLNLTLIDMRFVKPIDEELLKELSKNHKLFVTIEENVIAGGAGSSVNEFVSANSLDISVLNFGISDEFPVVGSPEDQKEAAKLTTEELLKQIKTRLEK